jgi:hypothetical protein
VRIVTPLLDGLYYRLGWNGADGKPSNKRVVWTLCVFTGLALVWALGFKMIEKAGANPAAAITETYVFLVLGVIFAGGGHYLISQKLQGSLPSPGSPSDSPPDRSSTAVPAP